MAPDDDDSVLRVRRDCVIPVSELTWRFGTSSGPGGQHANRAATRSEVIFDISGSSSLTDVQRSKLMSRFGDRLVVAADDHRSQVRNRSLALERLRSRLGEALAESKPRRRTKPSRGARRRRVDAKRRRGEVKRLRGRVDPGDH